MKILLITQTRNKKGQAARTEQPLLTDVLRIGRGTDCKLYLPDPRVALHHAVVRAAADGTCFIEAETGAVSIDGSFERAGKMRVNQRILVGPYELIVLPGQDNYDLVLSVELVEPLREGVDEVRSQVKAGLQSTWLSKRIMSWSAFALILLAFLAWPVLNAVNQPPAAEKKEALKQAVTPDAAWDVGPLASAHASFGRD